MRYVNGLIIGLLLGGILGFAGGYNHGRNAPIFSNPFEKRDLGSRLERATENILDEARRQIHDATR